MVKVDLTVSIIVILSLSTVFAPIFTTILNNRHQLKIKKLELKQKEYERTVLYKRHLFENYLKCAGKCIAYADEQPLHEFGEYYLVCLMYAPSHIQDVMKDANSKILAHEWSEANALFEKLTSDIRVLFTKIVNSTHIVMAYGA